MNLSYGPNGGLPAYQLDAIRQGRPVTVAAQDTFHNPFFEDDIVGSIPGLLAAATVPATITNWAGPQVVSMREYCTYLGELTNLPVTFEEVEGFIRSRAIDTSHQESLLGRPATNWRDGFQLLVERRST